MSLLRIFLFSPGKIMRILFQIGDFYFIIIFLSIILEYITILFIMNFQIHMVLGPIFILLFSFYFGNFIALPIWELIQLRWLKNKNPLQTIFNIFNKNIDKCVINGNKILSIEKFSDLLLGIIFYIYAFGIINVLTSTGFIFDLMNKIFLIIQI